VHLAGRDGQVDAVERADAAEVLRQPADGERRRPGGRLRLTGGGYFSPQSFRYASW